MTTEAASSAGYPGGEIPVDVGILKTLDCNWIIFFGLHFWTRTTLFCVSYLA
jgi:hypothetical protein